MTTENPPANLRILIVGTPKTGNTWLQHLLATAYNVPILDFCQWGNWKDISRRELGDLNSSWIAKYHLRPRAESFEWARKNNVVLITMVRHPGDVLVSLYHYVQHLAGVTQIDPEAVRFLLSDPQHRNNSSTIPMAEGLEAYVSRKFFHSLNFSIAWLHSGLSYGVRYEGLWSSPVAVLRALTNKIRPISMEAVKEAVDQCRIDRLRDVAATGEGRAFFRTGGVGGWRASLPPEIVELFRTLPPYPLQFKWLNYDLELEKVVTTRRVPGDFYPISGPFMLSQSDLLTPAIYSSFIERFPRADLLEHGSLREKFYLWLNAAAEDDPCRGQVTPIITNLGAYIYEKRPDLRKAFPDLYGRDRAGFSNWFVEYVPLEHAELHINFTARICESWTQGPAPNFSPLYEPEKRRPFWHKIRAMTEISAKIWLISSMSALLDSDAADLLTQAHCRICIN